MPDDRRDVETYISETYQDNKNDEIINVKLPRAKYDLLRKMLEREEAMGWFGRTIRTHWVWAIGGGLVTLFLLWNHIQALLAKV
jgi:hypothetical protein